MFVSSKEMCISNFILKVKEKQMPNDDKKVCKTKCVKQHMDGGKVIRNAAIAGAIGMFSGLSGAVLGATGAAIMEANNQVHGANKCLRKC
jgi:hypothetical protein